MIIETARLRIRPFVAEDVPQAFAYLSDPEVMRNVEPPFSLAQTKGFIADCGISRRLVYAIAEKAGQRVIGHAIYHPFDTPAVYEIGWILHKSAWRKGYGRETGLALMDHAFRRMAAQKVVAETTPDNLASIRLIEHLGMQRACADSALLLYEKRRPLDLRAGCS